MLVDYISLGSRKQHGLIFRLVFFLLKNLKGIFSSMLFENEKYLFLLHYIIDRGMSLAGSWVSRGFMIFNLMIF